MTKYREILSLPLWTITAKHCSKHRCFAENRSQGSKTSTGNAFILPLDENLTDATLETLMFPRNQRYPNKNGCRISTTSRRSCSATVSTKNSSGRSTWRNAASPATSRSCIPSSVITSSRMSRSAAQPCISTESPASRSKLTGQEILRRSPIGYRRDHPRISLCGCHDIQPVSLR